MEQKSTIVQHDRAVAEATDQLLDMLAEETARRLRPHDSSDPETNQQKTSPAVEEDHAARAISPPIS